MSVRSPSISEGEVGSGIEEKVIAKVPRDPTSSAVDPYSRLESSSRASHTQSYGAANGDKRSATTSSHRPNARSRQMSPYRSRRRSRSRSRSPFRHNTERSPSPWRPGKENRAEKRRHDHDHYGRDVSGPQRSRRRAEDVPLNDNERRDSKHHRGTNNVSQKIAFVKEQDNRSRARVRDAQASPDRGASTQLVRDHKFVSQGVSSTGSRSNFRQNVRAQDPNGGNRQEHGSRLRRDSKPHSQPSSHESGDRSDNSPSANDRGSKTESPDVNELTGTKPILSEAEQIEQRRRRRAEIKAKVQADLRVAAIENNVQHGGLEPNNNPDEYGRDIATPQSPAPSISSIGTPRDVSTPGSPAEPAIIRDEDLVNHHATDTTVDEEGPSAADFDPNDAANEDRPDHKQQPAAPEAEDPPAMSIQHDDSPSIKQKDDFDMFADDDDDMFAPKDAPAKIGESSLQGLGANPGLMDNPDLPSGHYRVVLGEVLNERYVVKQNIGQGTFAVVVRATDLQTGQLVAIKIACNNDTMLKAGRKEMDFVKLLNEKDPEDKKHIIRFLDQFTHRRHLCLVFENLNADLREILKKFGRNVGLDISAMRVFARQIFTALLHLKSVSVLHADLKPDNILVNDTQNSVKICDLGTATFTIDAELTPYLVSRFYRAPEVILGSEFSFGIDMWSIGCTLFELYCGRILFSGATNNQMLRQMQDCRGKLPNRMLKKAAMAPKHFDENYVFYSHEEDKVTKNMIARPVPTFVAAEKSGKDLKSKLRHLVDKMSRAQQMEHEAFVDLLDKCLQLDPERRIDPKKALMHHFFSRGGKPVTTKSSTHASLAFLPSTR